MKNLKVINIDNETIEFENGLKLCSNNEKDCCEAHYLSMEGLTIEDFNGLEFDLTKDDFFKRIEGYGIELISIKGHSIRIHGYCYSNGYYSSKLNLVLTNGKDFTKTYNIS